MAAHGLAHAFTKDNAREMASRSAAVRREKRDAQRERTEQLARILETLDRSQLGPFAIQGAMYLAQAAITGEIPEPEDALERKRLIEAAELLHRIGRLEMGESTSNALHAAVDVDALATRRAELAARLAALDDTTE